MSHYRESLILLLAASTQALAVDYIHAYEINNNNIKIIGDAPADVKDAIIYSLKRDKPKFKIYGEHLSIDACEGKPDLKRFQCDYAVSYDFEYRCWNVTETRTYSMEASKQHNNTYIFGRGDFGLVC